MIIAEQMKSNQNNKSKLLKRLIDDISMKSIKDLEIFDSTSIIGVKTSFYLVDSGMIEEFEYFVTKIRESHKDYDFEMTSPGDRSENTLSRLIEQVKTNKIGDLIEKALIDDFGDLSLYEINNLSIESVDNMNNTITNIAVANNNLELIKWVIEKKNISPHILIEDNKEFVDSLLLSILTKNNKILSYILDKLKNEDSAFFALNDYKDYGRFLLIHAALSKNNFAIKKLLDMRANINANKGIENIRKASKILLNVLAQSLDVGLTVGTHIATWIPIIRVKPFEATLDLIKQNYFSLSKGKLTKEQEIEGIRIFNKIKKKIFNLDNDIEERLKYICDIINKKTNKSLYEEELLKRILILIEEVNEEKRSKNKVEKMEALGKIKKDIFNIDKEWEEYQMKHNMQLFDEV